VENDDDCVADDVLDENFIAEKPGKPGTSLRLPTGQAGRPETGRTYRPR